MSNYCAVCGKKLGILESGVTLDNNQSEFKICTNCKTKEEHLSVEREEKDFGYAHAARKWFNSCLEQGSVEDGAVETVKRLIHESEKSEADNIESHHNHSTKLNDLMMTTGYNFEGYRILEYKSVLSGEVVLGTGFFSEFDASVSDVLGISSSAMEGKAKQKIWR